MKCFLLLLLPVSCLASQTCNDCAALYGSVYAQAVSVSNNLVNCKSHINIIKSELVMMEGQMNSIINYATLNDGHYDASINGLASATQNNIANTRASLASLETSLDGSIDETYLILRDLADFNCDCGSSSSLSNITVVVTNSCECPPYLVRIAMVLERIENGTVDFIQSITWSLWDVIEPNIQEIKRRLTVPDDDFKSDLSSLFSQLNQAIAQGNDLLEISTSANINQSTFNKSIDYMSNSDLALAYLYTTEYQNMIINRRSSRRLDDILSVISNININVTNKSDNSNQWSVDLAFISNYLYNIQRSYYELFNTRNTVNLSGQNPFQPNSVASIATNFWGWLKADLSGVSGNNQARTLLSNRAQAYVAYKQRYTNWWDRIEFAFYGLAGGFDVGFAQSSDFNSTTISNNVNQYISATNFVSGITAVFENVTNSVDTLAAAFKDFTDSFHFTSQGEFSHSFVVCPSFQFGDFQFEGITFDMYEVSDICSIIRSACRLIWTSLFSFLGLFLGIRFFVELGKAIAHIFVMLKTLL